MTADYNPATVGMELSGGRYRITAKLGEGGMGEVYRAEDTRLQRAVAIKMLRRADETPAARERLWREARAAASVSHPNICQLYEIGEEQGTLFLAMELLDGEPLGARVARGPLPLGDAVSIALATLGALSAIHARGIAHRDLKPSNIYLTPHGVKLLDFGLARPIESDLAATRANLTVAGVIVGTPRYMSPEQAAGDAVDTRSDLFALGALLYEMLSGRPAFAGDSAVQVLHAVTYDQPPALVGSPAVSAIDRVIHRALAKRPADRYGSADGMAADLRQAAALGDGSDVPVVRAMRRIIVLPFRVLRADPDTDFLAFSLPDALTMSLSSLESLVVRSSLAAARFAGDASDVRRIATEADVDIVLAGTLLRAGDQLRITAQLTDAAGTLMWSHEARAPVGDLFQLQDSLVLRIVESLALPLSAREHRQLKRDAPANAEAYEFYLRANQLTHGARIWTDPTTWTVARDLYRQSIEHDPRFAPAWAELGRVHQLMAKTLVELRAENVAQAEAALTRALELSPDLARAHHIYAALEVDHGRAREAMERLILRARQRGSEPDLFVALCQACRYCGLLDASIAAHERATRLDSKVVTSVPQTYFVLGDAPRVVEYAERVLGRYGYIGMLALAASGRTADAIAASDAMTNMPAPFRGMVLAARRLLEGDREGSARALDEVVEMQSDPEALFYVARHYAFVGKAKRSLATLATAIDRGYWCYPSLLRDPWLASVRTEPEFERMLASLGDAHREIVAAYHRAGGPGVLGSVA